MEMTMSNNDMFRENAEQVEEYRFVQAESGEAVHSLLSERVNALCKQGFRVLGMTANEHRFVVCMGRVRPEVKE
jgi:hypothetical protein